MTDWDEAAKKPRRAIFTMCVMGAIGGFLIGFFINDSVGFGITLGIGFAVILGVLGWRIIHDPARRAEIRQRRQDPWRVVRRGSLRLGVLFSVPLIAAVVGAVTDSRDVFLGAFAVLLIVAFLVNRSLPR